MFNPAMPYARAQLARGVGGSNSRSPIIDGADLCTCVRRRGHEYANFQCLSVRKDVKYMLLEFVVRNMEHKTLTWQSNSCMRTQYIYNHSIYI